VDTRARHQSDREGWPKGQGLHFRARRRSLWV